MTAGAPVRLSFVWMDGIYENKDGCTYRGHYSGVTSGFPPSLPAADLYVVGAGNWEAAYCARPWQTTKTYLPPFLRWVDAHATQLERRRRVGQPRHRCCHRRQVDRAAPRRRGEQQEEEEGGGAAPPRVAQGHRHNVDI